MKNGSTNIAFPYMLKLAFLINKTYHRISITVQCVPFVNGSLISITAPSDFKVCWNKVVNINCQAVKPMFVMYE